MRVAEKIRETTYAGVNILTKYAIMCDDCMWVGCGVRTLSSRGHYSNVVAIRRCWRGCTNVDLGGRVALGIHRWYLRRPKRTARSSEVVDGAENWIKRQLLDVWLVTAARERRYAQKYAYGVHTGPTGSRTGIRGRSPDCNWRKAQTNNVTYDEHNFPSQSPACTASQGANKMATHILKYSLVNYVASVHAVHMLAVSAKPAGATRHVRINSDVISRPK